MAEGVVVRYAKGVVVGMRVHGIYNRLQIVGIKVGVGIKAYHQFVIGVLLHNTLKEQLSCPSHTLLLARPSATSRTAVDDHYRQVTHLVQKC